MKVNVSEMEDYGKNQSNYYLICLDVKVLCRWEILQPLVISKFTLVENTDNVNFSAVFENNTKG